MNLVGFIIEIYYDAQPCEHQKSWNKFVCCIVPSAACLYLMWVLLLTHTVSHGQQVQWFPSNTGVVIEIVLCWAKLHCTYLRKKKRVMWMKELIDPLPQLLKIHTFLDTKQLHIAWGPDAASFYSDSGSNCLRLTACIYIFQHLTNSFPQISNYVQLHIIKKGVGQGRWIFELCTTVIQPNL